MMWGMLIRLWFAVLLVGLVFGDNTELEERQQKSRGYRFFSEATEDSPFVFITDETHKNLLRQPRPYSIVALYTTMDPRHQCEPCDFVAKQFSDAALAYQTMPSHQKKENPIFFALVDYGKNPETFNNNAEHLSGVPVLVFVPQNLNKSPKVPIFLPERKIDFDRWGWDLQGLIGFIQSQSGFKIEAAESIPWLAGEGQAYAMIPLAVLLVFFVYSYWGNKWLWFGIVLIGYFAVTAGFWYNRLMNASWLYMARGQYVIFYPSARQQFILEGIIAALLSCGACTFLILLNNHVPNQTTVFGQFSRFVVYFTGLGLCFAQLNKLHDAKLGW